MALNTNARFYRLDHLPDFDVDGKHVGLFVYVPEYTLTDAWTQGYSAENWDGRYRISTPPITIASEKKVNGGLWFGGRLGWEHLTNVADISWEEIYHWFETNIAGEAEIFSATAVSTGTGAGTEYSIFDPVLDISGLHASRDGSDIHTFTVGDGALKISGKGATTTTTNNNNSTPALPAVTTNDVHSANDVSDSTLTLDDSLIWTPSGSAAPFGGTIGVRTKTAVTAENPVVTLQDIAGLSGAMHLIGTLNVSSEWPDHENSIWYTGNNGATATGSQTTQIHEGDTFIVTTTHTGPGGVPYEVGDTVFYYKSGGTLVYKVVNQNITTGTQNGQHVIVDMPGGSWALGKLVIAASTGIATSNLSVSDFIKDIEITQEIVNESASSEGSNIGATYTVTTTITKPDGSDSDSDSDTETDTRSFTLHSNNNSLTIQEDTSNSNADHQINFDLVWLTTMA